jgi:formylglycine-generating enzyme
MRGVAFQFAICALLGVGCGQTGQHGGSAGVTDVAGHPAATSGSGGQGGGADMSSSAGMSGNSGVLVAGGMSGSGGVSGSSPGVGGYTAPNDGSCAGGAERCSASGHEVCAGGAWRPARCPLDLPTCENGACVVRGPKLVKVGNFYIDSTEVTREQYRTFLSSNPEGPPEPSRYCGGNRTLEPAGDWSDNPTFPVTNVTWCDADSYCKWADKHLCGSIDRTQKLEPDDFFDPQLSQWALACGGPNPSAHVDPSPTCNDARNAAMWSIDTATCENASPGVWDLEGNAGEWIDGCRDGDHEGDIADELDECYFVGRSPQLEGSCTTVSSGSARGSIRKDVGFRCCSG